MSRKVYVEIKARLIINMDEGVELDDVIADMNYSFSSDIDGAEIVDMEIKDYEVQDSK